MKSDLPVDYTGKLYKWYENVVLAKLKKSAVRIEDSPVSAKETGYIFSLFYYDLITHRQSKIIFDDVWERRINHKND